MSDQQLPQVWNILLNMDIDPRSRTSINFSLFMIIVVFVLLSIASFSIGFWYVPAQHDDLVLLSSVARTPNPLIYFVSDWGLQNGAYRPLHSLVLWVTYRIFGVWSLPNYLFNAFLHCSCIVLLLKIMARYQSDAILLFLFSALSLFSMYTWSPLYSTSDRPIAVVALMLLLTIDHCAAKQISPSRFNPWYITCLSVIALLMKESGMIVPLFALYWGARLNYPVKTRMKLIIFPLVIIGCYCILRLSLFASSTSSYSESGYLLGSIKYEWGQLPAHVKFVAMLENMVKNITAAYCPVFDEAGQLMFFATSKSSLLWRVPIWGLTFGITILSLAKSPNDVQKSALFIIICNGVIHYAIFRYRTVYLAQLAFSLFLCSVPHFNPRSNRKIGVIILSTLLLCLNIFWVSNSLFAAIRFGYNELQRYELQNVVRKSNGLIDQQIVEQVMNMYRKN